MENSKKTINIIKELIAQTNDNMGKVKKLRVDYITNGINKGIDYMDDELQQSADRCLRAYDELLRELKHLEYVNCENVIIVSDYEKLSEESKEFVDGIKNEEYKKRFARFLIGKERVENKDVNQCVTKRTGRYDSALSNLAKNEIGKMLYVGTYDFSRVNDVDESRYKYDYRLYKLTQEQILNEEKLKEMTLPIPSTQEYITVSIIVTSEKEAGLTIKNMYGNDKSYFWYLDKVERVPSHYHII